MPALLSCPRVAIGTAFTNRDGSLNGKLDAMPTNAMIHIRDYDPNRDRPGFRSDGGGSARNDFRFAPGELPMRATGAPLDGGLR